MVSMLIGNRSLDAVALALELTSTFAFELSTILPALCLGHGWCNIEISFIAEPTAAKDLPKERGVGRSKAPRGEIWRCDWLAATTLQGCTVSL